MNEAETRAEHIDPALKAAGWGVVEGSRVLREHGITLGQLAASFVERFDSLHAQGDRATDVQAPQRAALEELKRSLLHQAFSGGLS